MKKVAEKGEKLVLKVEIRTLLGKKINKLRRQGLIPANIFGTDFKSTSISVKEVDFKKIYRIARETGVIYMPLNDKEIPVLIKHLQKHPVTSNILHVDFRKIDLTKKIETTVPVKVIGISEAVAQKGGVLLLQSETLLVEALPQNIPHEIEVDISSIKEVGQEIKVETIKKSDKYEIKTPNEKVIVSVVAHKEESITPDTATAAPEVLTEAPVEGEGEATPTADSKTEDNKAAKPASPKQEAPAPKK